MIKSFDFYFDFASPYTFLAHKEIRKIEKQHSINIKYMPVLLGGLLKSAGIKPNIDIPIKAKYMIKDCKLWAEKYSRGELLANCNTALPEDKCCLQ